MKITVQAGKYPVKLSKRQLIQPGQIAQVEAGAFITQLIHWGDLIEVTPDAPAKTQGAETVQTVQPSAPAKGLMPPLALAPAPAPDATASAGSK